jgi:hypothetical protein
MLSIVMLYYAQHCYAEFCILFIIGPECHHALCCYAVFCILYMIALNVNSNAVMLNVVILNVVVPF